MAAANLGGSSSGTTVPTTQPNGASHTVSFDRNGGSGSMPDETHGTPTALTNNAFSRTGYTFSGWNTASNGTGTDYANGAIYSFNADVTLYALWAGPHTVTFDRNGFFGGGSMPNDTHSTPTALTNNAFSRTGYTFSGWNTSSNGSGIDYANGAIYSFRADVTLYAQWRHN